MTKRTPKETWDAIRRQAESDEIDRFLAKSRAEVDASLRAKGHDPAAVRDQWQERLREEQHALEVDVHQPIELRLGRFTDEGIVAVAGIVHQMIEGVPRPLFAQRRPQALGERRETRHVAGVEL